MTEKQVNQFTLPIAGNKYFFTGSQETDGNNLTVQVTATGLDAVVDVIFKHGHLRDITLMPTQQTLSGVDVITTITNGTYLIHSNTFYGLFGAIEIDELTATTGTIDLITVWE